MRRGILRAIVFMGAVCVSACSMGPAAPPPSAAGAVGQTTAIDATKIDAATGRSGQWVSGIYLVDFMRPNLPVSVGDVRLAPGQIDSFLTFAGTDDHAEVMGEICAQVEEVTAAAAALRAGGLDITGIHNHFLGESPRLMFLHFMAHGSAAQIAKAFRDAVATTSTPMTATPAPKVSTTPPDWAKTIQAALGHPSDYSSDYGGLAATIPRADFSDTPTHNFWNSHYLAFQEAPGGRIATTGDLAVTASELNPVLSALTAAGFQVLGAHNHMTEDAPHLFFVHFWKVEPVAEAGASLKAALAATKMK